MASDAGGEEVDHEELVAMEDVNGGGMDVNGAGMDVNGAGINADATGTSIGNEYSLSDYKVGKTIGLGSFGKVKIAEHVLTGLKVAIKILHRRKIKEQNMEERVKREISILRMIMHPHIIRLYEVIETPTHIFLVLEYLKSGELFDYIIEKGRLFESEARRLFQQILSGVEYCHSNMVVHRDLKPENLLLDSMCNVKIADFGLSNVMRDGHFLTTSCGSPNYAAPEVISGKLYAGPEVDVWSCGVILYALLCGTLPYDDENIPTLFRKIKGGIYTLPSHLSPGAKNLISNMLLVDPVKRITIPEVRQHSWFQTNLRCYPNEIIQEASKIKQDVVKEVISLGFNEGELAEALYKRVTTKATVTYYLLLDNRVCVRNGLPRNEVHQNEEKIAKIPTRTSLPVRCMQAKGQPSADRPWALGFKTCETPREIMTVMLKSFQELQISWKKMGPYTVKGIWFPPVPIATPTMRSSHKSQVMMDVSDFHENGDVEVDNGGQDRVRVKFEAQLFLMHDYDYMLDLQLLQGPEILFLEFCFAFQMKLWSYGI